MFGLLALMEIQASRLKARAGPDGEPIALPQQNRARWDQLLIRRGIAALERAERARRRNGPYALAGRARRLPCPRADTSAETDWPRIAALYDELREVMPSPVVDLNRAVAHSMAFGPDAGLALIADIEDDASSAQLCAVAGGERRFPVARRAFRRSESTIRTGGGAKSQCQREGLSARPRGGLRSHADAVTGAATLPVCLERLCRHTRHEFARIV